MGREELHLQPRRKYPRRKVKGEISLKVLSSELDRLIVVSVERSYSKVEARRFF
jgi:hypothetical protein